jgi:outer membrane protein TolC
MRLPLLLSTVAVAALLAGCTVTPTPLTSEELMEISTSNISRVQSADQEPVYGEISLHEAMARALKYNLDHKVEMMQVQLRQHELELAHYSLLPKAVANSGYTERDNDLSTGDRNLTTGIVHAPRTTSTPRANTVSDMTFSWNILDFGLSYIRARQSADRVLIAEEMKRKVIARIMEDVRTAYWRAVSSDRMLQRLHQLEGRARQAQGNARALSASPDSSPVLALTSERELIEIRRVAQELQDDLSVAKAQLASLMNIAPDAKYALTWSNLKFYPHAIRIDARDMVMTALTNRAELKDVTYQQRINEHEAHAALLELLPGIDLYASTNKDNNDFLLNNNWVTWGAKASWNVMRVFQYPAKDAVIEGQADLLDTRALALTMAVMTQVHVSRIRYVNMAKEYATAREYLDVQTRLVRQMRQEAQADKISEQTLIREELNTLVAEAKRDIAFSRLQAALANVYATAGLDPYASDLSLNGSVQELTTEIHALWFERGDFGGPGNVILASR